MIGWAIEALVASTLLMLVVLALRGPIAARFGAHAAYLLWLLPALRMVLPPVPEVAEPVRAVPIHFDIARLVAAATVKPHAADIAAASAPAAPGIDWLTVMLVVWFGGAIVYLAWQLGRHYRFMSVALERANPGFLRGGIKVRLSPIVSGPLAAGIFHRHILLPADFAERYSDAEQRLALAHEIAHHRRGDLIANGAALLILALHWFNPVAHWAYRAFRTDQELACDATVLGAAPESRSDYGRALLKSARAGMPAAAACALGPATQLKRRIKMIAQSTRSRARRVAGATLATMLVGVGLGLTASGSIAAPSEIAPTSVKPLLRAHPQPLPKPRMIVIADRDVDVSGHTNRDADAAPVPPAAAPATPLPPVPPVDAVAPVPPVPPVPPVAAVAPVPPIPPIPYAGMSDEQRQAMREALRDAAEARRAGEQARREAMREAREEARQAGREARQAGAEARREAMREAGQAARHAGEEARRAVANVDYAAISREAMAEARAELERECTHAGPAPANESDTAAITRLSTGCVDTAEINREVQDALREATEEIRRDKDLSEADRARALAAIDRTRAEMQRKFTH